MVIESLVAGKNVFVEKPLALNEEELEKIMKARLDSGKYGHLKLMVGYNRRFSPHAIKARELLGEQPGEMNITATVNAGYIPSNAWVHDMQTGGGRILGEACHFIDLFIFLTGSLVSRVNMNGMGLSPQLNTDNASVLLNFKNGSIGVINYFSNGSKSYAKERIEIYSSQRTLVIDNFKSIKAYGFKGFNHLKTRLDKGHKEQFRRLEEILVKGEQSPIPFEEIVNSTRTAFGALESMKKGEWIQID
jgi:predicted dehydrogenase